MTLLSFLFIQIAAVFLAMALSYNMFGFEATMISGVTFIVAMQWTKFRYWYKKEAKR